MYGLGRVTLCDIGPTPQAVTRKASWDSLPVVSGTQTEIMMTYAWINNDYICLDMRSSSWEEFDPALSRVQLRSGLGCTLARTAFHYYGAFQ